MAGNRVIEVSPARRAEAPALARLSRDHVESGLGWSWRAPRILGMMRNPDSVVLAARVDGATAGFAIMEFHLEHAHLNLLAVDPRYRRLGLASRLLDWLTETARVAGIHRIDLEVRRQNQGAIRFYEHHAYVATGIARRYYSGVEDALRMSRRLIGTRPPDILH